MELVGYVCYPDWLGFLDLSQVPIFTPLLQWHFPNNGRFSGIIGLVKDDDEIVDRSFDILSLEALVLIPR